MTRTPVLNIKPIRVIGSNIVHYYASATDPDTGFAFGTTAETEDEALQRVFAYYQERADDRASTHPAI